MIYFDNAATTQPDEQCLAEAMPYVKQFYFNPSGLYREGYDLHLAIKSWRENILKTIADTSQWDLIITSCGSEADNQAIFGGGKRGNIVTTLGEHSAVFQTVNEAKQRGLEVRFAQLNADGSINLQHLFSLIDEKTSLVSVIHVNNETGAINDINYIATQVKSINPRTIFHSDGVQAFGKIPFRLGKDVDMYSVSAHKIGGLKGCGALFKRKKVIIKPYIYGGGQENGLRSGTENVLGIKMLELCAVKKYQSIKENYLKATQLRDRLWELLDKQLFVRVSSEQASPYILTVASTGVRGETILHEVDDLGLIIGTGSACSSNEKKRFSRVMLACNLNNDLLDGVLRLSIGNQTTMEEVQQAAQILNQVVKRRKEIMS